MCMLFYFYIYVYIYTKRAARRRARTPLTKAKRVSALKVHIMYIYTYIGKLLVSQGRHD